MEDLPKHTQEGWRERYAKYLEANMLDGHELALGASMVSPAFAFEIPCDFFEEEIEAARREERQRGLKFCEHLDKLQMLDKPLATNSPINNYDTGWSSAVAHFNHFFAAPSEGETKQV